MKGFLLVAGLILFVILFWILGPLLALWALNTLFPVLAIPYKFATWVAMLIFMGLLKTNISAKVERH
jgi:hypothetical protein